MSLFIMPTSVHCIYHVVLSKYELNLVSFGVKCSKIICTKLMFALDGRIQFSELCFRFCISLLNLTCIFNKRILVI